MKILAPLTFTKLSAHLLKFKTNLNRIRNKVLIIYLILTIIPLTIINVAVYSIWSNMERKNTIKYSERFLGSGKDVLESELTQMSKINMLFNSNKEVQNILLSISNDDSDYDYKILKSQWFFIPLLTTIKSANSSIYSFSFFGINDKTIYSTAFNFPGFDPSQEDWYKRIKSAKGSAVIFGSHKPFYDSSKNINVISIGQQMKSYSEQKPIGVTLIDYNLSLLKEKCFNLKYSEDSRIILTDEAGKLIFDTDEENFGIGITKSFLNHIRKNKQGHISENFNGVPSIIIFDEVESTGWKLISVVTQEKINKPIRDFLEKLYFSIILLIFLISLFSILLFNRQLNPINKVALMMRKNVDNNFKERIEIPNINTEVDILCESFNIMTDRIENLITLEYDAKLKQKEAELTALEAQINPHFLYNTLETLRWNAVKNNQDELADVIYALSSNLRYSIVDPGIKVKIRDEIDWLKKYLYIQSTRFRNKFEVFFEIEERILDYKFHKLVLQPFIENSILHGFENMTTGGILHINAHLEGKSTLRFEIVDNGEGFPEESVELVIHSNNYKQFHDIGIGLNNAVSRIALYYSKFEVIIKSRMKAGTSIAILIDLEGAKDE